MVFFGGFQYGFGWIIGQFRDGFDGLKMISVDYSPFSRWFRWIVGRLGGFEYGFGGLLAFGGFW